MAERRAATKSRRLGSSRRKQLHEGSGEAPAAAPGPTKELPWESQIVQRLQEFFREQDKEQVGFVTRSDMQKLQVEDFPCSTEELELIFDGLDAAGTGRLSTDEFTAGLRQFLRSQKATRAHHRRKTASRRVRLVLPSLALEGADSEEQRHFAAFMDQLGTANISEEQEIWQLWVKLRQDEPQLLGNLEDFLAKMKHRIQEARNKKEALEVTLKKRVAEHNKEVQQLCEALEQQIHQEQQWLEQESTARSHHHGVELQQALDASEKEVQRLVTAQMELEIRCRSLRSTQPAASTQNQQLEESNRVLEERLQHLHQQLQQTQKCLQTARAAVAREHEEESGDRAVAEPPDETPMSPQMNLEKSEKYHSETRIRLGSQSSKPKAKSTHRVFWEVPPAEISVLGAPPRLSSTEEDIFPELLKEEHFSDQSSLLREMNDAIAALSTQLKLQVLGAPSTPADAACHLQDGAEPQTGMETTTTHGSTPGVLQETLPGHVSHELFEGDLKEGPAAAELRAPDVTQAGASMGAEHRWAQEPGAEQGKSVEEAQRMLFPQGKGAGVKELMLKVAERLQGAPGESTEAGEQVPMEVEGEGWMQEETGWEKAAQPPGEAEEEALSQGENLEAGLGPPEAGEAGLAVGQQLTTDELGLAVAPEESLGLGQEADPQSELSKKHEIKPGEHLEPEPPSQGETQMGAAQEDSVLPEVTVAAGPGMLEDERISAEVQPWGETLDDDIVVAPDQCGGSSRGGAEEGEMMEVTQPGEAELQAQGESARGDPAWGGNVGAEVLLPVSVPPTDVQEGGVGTDVTPLEAQSSDANVQLLAEVEAALQPPSETLSPGTGQGGNVAPGVQPLEKDEEPELGLGEEMGAAVVHGEGPSPAETPVGSPDLHGLFPVKIQALELVEAEGSQLVTQLCGDVGPETPHGEGDCAATQLGEEAEDRGQGQGECELPQEPELDPHEVTIREGDEAGSSMQPWEDVTPGMLEDQSTDANVQLLAEGDEIKLTPGGSMEADLQLSSEVSSLDPEQGGNVALDVQPLDQVNKAEVVELEIEDAWADVQVWGGLSPETPHGEGDCAAMQLGEEAEDGGQGQDECELPQEPEIDPHGVTIRQGEGAGAGGQPREEAVVLDTLENQSTDANVQLLAEGDELRLTPGGSVETDLQLSSEASSLDPEQGGNVAPDVQPLDQSNKVELVELVDTGDSCIDTQLRGDASPEPPHGEGDCAAVQLGEEAEDGGQGQGGRELPQEPELDLQGAGVGQGEGAGSSVQLWEDVVIPDVLENQSTDANMQLLAEGDEIKLTSGGSMEADLQLSSEVSSLDPEQGGSVGPDVQPLDQSNKPELVDLVEAGDTQRDTQLCGDASSETRQGVGDHTALQIIEEAEDGEQGQDECELPQEPELDPQGVAIRQGEGAGAGGQPWEEAVVLDTLENQSTDANVQPLIEPEELELASDGSTEANLAPLGAAGMWEGEQGQSPGSEAGLCAAHTADMWEGAAGAHVSSLAEATLHPKCATAGPGLEAMVGALTGPDGQILEETQTLEIPQGERADAGGRPLDGAQGLEVVQGERLEAGVRSLVETQGLELKQDHENCVFALASLVPEVTLQISTQKLETMMQEDVLVPDMWWLGTSGEAAQSDLLEQVSAQADVRLHAASQQMEEKLLHMRETEQVAAGYAEPPKQEVPPVSTICTRAQQEDDAGNDQLGMVLKGSSLGDAANSTMQLQRQLLGEEREDLDVGHWEKKQEAVQKTSQEGEPSPREQGAVSADGAGAAQRVSTEAFLDPDHLYNVLFVGDSNVGKTSFLYRLHADIFNPQLTATVGLDYQVKNLVVDNKRFALRLWDSAGQERYRSITKQFFRKADGVVLMYDITSEYSFSDVRYWLSCIQEGADNGVAILLLGNKTDCAAERQVPTMEGEHLAKEHQLMFFECSAASGHNVSESMVSLIRMLKVREDELKNKAKEVPKAPQKKKGCCW